MSDLERAIQIAAEAHQGQKDRGGMPYILHPLRLMMKMNDPETMTAAVLHDVVEDSSWTLNKLQQENFSPRVIEIVGRLTHRKHESYEDYIDQIRDDPDACKIKRADLEDNMNLLRLNRLSEKDFQRLAKYHRAYIRLAQK